jgi:hypothetical protein
LKLQSIAATLLCVRCASLPCADAHGYKDIGALRLLLALFSFLHLSPFALHLSPFTLRPSPFAFHPSPFTFRLSPFTLRPSPFAFHPSPFALFMKTADRKIVQENPVQTNLPPVIPNEITGGKIYYFIVYPYWIFFNAIST